MLRKFVVLLFATFSEALSLDEGGLTCREFTIAVNILSQNKLLPSSLTYETIIDYTNFLQVVALAPLGTSVGNYSIAARYCEPTQLNKTRSDTLQLLVHGVTYTKEYWSGLAAPDDWPSQDQYSWLKFAADQGYPTLSIDRLCNGDSSHPHGLLDCQLPSQTEVVHVVAQMARSGRVPTLHTAFKKVVYVGHSYGSMIGDNLAARYPNDIDAYILSGFSFDVSNSLGADVVYAQFVPAAVSVPSRFGHLATDPSYIVATSINGIQGLFYYGSFDQNVLQYDYNHRGSATIGEVASFFSGQQSAPSYTGPLFVLNGNEDKIFCSESVTAAILNTTADCAKMDTATFQTGLPSVNQFSYHLAAGTGHCLNLHRSAQQSFQAAHDFLASAGF